MDTAVEKIEDSRLRLRIREYARQQRHDLRTNTTDALRFGLGQIKDAIDELEQLGVKDVQGMANRIKRRKHATTEDMYRLCHAFLQGNDNINSFALVPGAIQVLVKELTGAQLSRQVEAAECLCNLSLGEAHVCEKITTLAGSYLVTYLTSQEARLKRSCLWTLANILATCSKCCQTLLHMQLATKLWKLYTAMESAGGEYQEDAGICLYLLARYTLPDDLTVEDRHYIAQHLHEKNPTQPGAFYYTFIVFQLELLLLERDACAPQYQHLYNFCLSQLESHDAATPAGKFNILYGVRLLTNIFATSPTPEQLHLDLSQIVKVLNLLFALKDDKLTQELLQLLRNLIDLQLLDKNQLLQLLVIPQILDPLNM